MGLKLPCALLLVTALLAGCAAGGTSVQPDQSAPPPDQSVLTAEPAADKLIGEDVVNDPESPYPMTELSWTVDMDGDGVDELVELRAEKAYACSEIEPEWFEITEYGLHPYTLLVTRGDTVYERPLGRDDNEAPVLYPWYFPLDSDYSVSFWTEDQSGRPVLVLAFDNMSQGGAGGVDVYAFEFLNGELICLPVPDYGIEAALDEETIISQVTVPETGYTETLDLMQWLADLEQLNREHGYDFTFKPIYDEDGALEWPAAPGNIDGVYHADPAETGIVLRQYIYGSAHMDGMGALVTAISWEDGEAVVLDQYFDWGY